LSRVDIFEVACPLCQVAIAISFVKLRAHDFGIDDCGDVAKRLLRTWLQTAVFDLENRGNEIVASVGGMHYLVYMSISQGGRGG